jgi:hypothetical protein
MPLALAFVMLVPISVHTIAGVSKAMMKRAMAEVDAIWRDVGVQFEWHDDADVPASLHVEVGDAFGHAGASELPLAWIGFVDQVPNDEIYASRANALALLARATSISKPMDLPQAAINEFIGRALGRALAHEVGHYLFRSRAHDPTGVMATRRSTTELFGPDRGRFRLTAEERNRLTAVLQRNRMAKHAPAPVP